MTPEDVAVKLENHEQEIKSLKHRMDKREKQEEALHQMAVSIGEMAVNMDYMAKEQKEQGVKIDKQGEKIDKLEHEPVEDYKHYKRTIIGCILTTIIGAVLGAILALVIAKGG